MGVISFSCEGKLFPTAHAATCLLDRCSTTYSMREAISDRICSDMSAGSLFSNFQYSHLWDCRLVGLMIDVRLRARLYAM